MVELGESRKIVPLGASGTSTIDNIKSAFKIEGEKGFFLQKFDKEWEDYIDIMDMEAIPDRAKQTICCF